MSLYVVHYHCYANKLFRKEVASRSAVHVCVDDVALAINLTFRPSSLRLGLFYFRKGRWVMITTLFEVGDSFL